jgi:hypothetical protein
VNCSSAETLWLTSAREPQHRTMGSEDRAGGIDPAVIDGDLVPDLGQEVLGGDVLRAVRQGERPDVARRDDRFGTFAISGLPAPRNSAPSSLAMSGSSVINADSGRSCWLLSCPGRIVSTVSPDCSQSPPW